MSKKELVVVWLLPGPSTEVVNVMIEKETDRGKMPEEKKITEFWSQMQELKGESAAAGTCRLH